MKNKRTWAAVFLVTMVTCLGLYLLTGRFLGGAVLSLVGYVSLVGGGRMHR